MKNVKSKILPIAILVILSFLPGLMGQPARDEYGSHIVYPRHRYLYEPQSNMTGYEAAMLAPLFSDPASEVLEWDEARAKPVPYQDHLGWPAGKLAVVLSDPQIKHLMSAARHLRRIN